MGKLVMTLGSENVFLRGFVINGTEYGPDTADVARCSMAKEVVITNFLNYEYVNIKGAKKENNRWYITGEDAKVYEFDIQHKLENAYISKRNTTNWIVNDMKRVITEVNDCGADIYRVIGYINGIRVISSIIKKIWHDDSTYHVITMSDSHFVWTIEQT